MATIQRFEDLICWQKSRLLVREIYRAMQGCKDYGFRDQIQRAAVSVLSNIAEGMDCSRLIQSFADKVKGGSRQGMQFKQVQKQDPMREILKELTPEVYKRFYKDK